MKRWPFDVVVVCTLVLCSGVAQAQGADEGSPPAAEPGTATAPTASVGVDWVTDYYFRGIVQETDSWIVQPYASSSFSLHEGTGALTSVALDVGVWSSLHGGPSGDPTTQTVPGAWYEADFYAGLSATLFGQLGIGATYTAYASPNGSFATVHELAVGVSYDDASAWGEAPLQFGGLAPSVTVARELRGTAFGDEPGTYIEVAIAPSIGLLDTESIELGLSVPAQVGMSLGDYYEAGAEDDVFGFASVGLNLSAGLPGVPDNLGSWQLDLAGSVLALGDHLAEANEGGSTEIVARLGLAVTY